MWYQLKNNHFLNQNILFWGVLCANFVIIVQNRWKDSGKHGGEKHSRRKFQKIFPNYSRYFPPRVWNILWCFRVICESQNINLKLIWTNWFINRADSTLLLTSLCFYTWRRGSLGLAVTLGLQTHFSRSNFSVKAYIYTPLTCEERLFLKFISVLLWSVSHSIPFSNNITLIHKLENKFVQKEITESTELWLCKYVVSLLLWLCSTV